MSQKNDNRIEEIQKREKFTARLIVVVSIFIGVLLTVMVMGLADYLF
jgi:hypothetical protein